MSTAGQARATAGRPWRRAAAWLALLAPFFYLSYGLANHLAATRAGVPSIVFGWERQVPFWAWTIFPYWSLNIFYGLSLFLAANRRELDRHAARLLSAQCIAVACFIAFPLHYSFGQPAATGAAGWLFDALRGFDQPYNQAPSLHVALVVILWDLYRRRLAAAWARALLHGWSLLIVGSVLTTWQHHFIDIPTGALLGVMCVWAWPLEARTAMPMAWRRGAGARRRRIASWYACGALAAGALALSGAPLTLLFGWPAASLALVALNYAGLGARGFQVDGRGRMHWAARTLLVPYEVGARLNARLWTRRLPPTREVRPGVWLASLERLRGAAPRSIPPVNRLLSLCAELPMPRGTGREARCLPQLDLVPASPAQLRAAATWIDAAQAQGTPAVVACALGFSRSVAAVACWLVLRGHARDVDEALRAIRQVHPQARLDADWREAVQAACAGAPAALPRMATPCLLSGAGRWQSQGAAP